MPLYIPVSGSEPSDFQPAIVTNRYYFSPSGEFVKTGLNADVLVAWPIWFSHTETWTRIGITCSVAGTTEKMRLGIYANATGNVPGALVVDAGEVTLSGTGALPLTISQQLQANTLYWLASINNDAGILTEYWCNTATSNPSDMAWVTGVDGETPNPSTGGVGYGGVFKSMTYGALPDPFGTPDTGFYTYAAAVWLRKV